MFAVELTYKNIIKIGKTVPGMDYLLAVSQNSYPCFNNQNIKTYEALMMCIDYSGTNSITSDTLLEKVITSDENVIGTKITETIQQRNIQYNNLTNAVNYIYSNEYKNNYFNNIRFENYFTRGKILSIFYGTLYEPILVKHYSK